MNPRPDGRGGEYRNPAINPTMDPEETSDTEDEPQEKQAKLPQINSASRQMAAAYAKDLAFRFAERELHQLDKRAKHAKTDRAKFNEWLQEFYTGHAEYVDAQLSGFCGALEIREMDRIAVVEKLAQQQAAQLRDADPEQLLSRWTGKLAQDHYSTLMELVT
jgi:hypothetical protein